MKPLASTLGSLALIALLNAGCVTNVPYPNGRPVQVLNPDDAGFVRGTGIESQDLVAVADKMARGILGADPIRNAAASPYVILDPVTNNTRFPINQDIFLRSIRVRLNEQAAGRVIFLARDRMETLERERAWKQEGRVLSSTDPHVNEFRGADYVLTGNLDGLSASSSQGMSDYILYSFQLIDANTSALVWESYAEVKKQGLTDAVYR